MRVLGHCLPFRFQLANFYFYLRFQEKLSLNIDATFTIFTTD
jgi:hypothetical protein